MQGHYTQSGGTNTISGCLFVGFGTGGSGTYNLGGPGLLSAGSEYVAYDGTRRFATQSGGHNAVSTALYLGFTNGNSDLQPRQVRPPVRADEYVGYVAYNGGTFA